MKIEDLIVLLRDMNAKLEAHLLDQIRPMGPCKFRGLNNSEITELVRTHPVMNDKTAFEEFAICFVGKGKRKEKVRQLCGAAFLAGIRHEQRKRKYIT